VTFLIIASYAYSYLLTDEFVVDKYLWQFYAVTICHKNTQMKAYDISNLTDELKSENMQ